MVKKLENLKEALKKSLQLSKIDIEAFINGNKFDLLDGFQHLPGDFSLSVSVKGPKLLGSFALIDLPPSSQNCWCTRIFTNYGQKNKELEEILLQILIYYVAVLGFNFVLVDPVIEKAISTECLVNAGFRRLINNDLSPALFYLNVTNK